MKKKLLDAVIEGIAAMIWVGSVVLGVGIGLGGLAAIVVTAERFLGD